ncbi:uncharacterized protein LOC126369217 isoform X2 [Pectinophora gossypiella]|uniref:uncharacterized protein LOC126369217 isoform X2 n=1 Tax=Pectinophora gossypiella TaxID=13191 RepID=UPI00214E3F50|nr:uncharacterized protein LOC126369217 isoform X2 [Pectinophora gossypiella]
MAEEDEIDILGDFSFNSCLAQNNQGIPSCSNREDTVHPQWLLDSVSTNWYDNQTKDSARMKDGPSRRLTGNKLEEKHNGEVHTTWSQNERELLVREMAKYGRNVRKISQMLKTKTEAEIQALIEAEYGVHLETPSFGMDKHEDHDGTPTAVQEEIVTDEIPSVLDIVTTGKPTVPSPKKHFRKKTYNTKKLSLLRPDALLDSKKSEISINPAEIFYEDDMIIGSTESVGSDMDSVDILSQKMAKQQKEKVKAMKKMGNHRRKVSKNYDRGKIYKSKELLKSPLGRQRKDSSLSEDSVKSPKMQIVLGSGQALPVSEGEQVIKIEKKKDSEPESDIEIDIDSDNEERVNRRKEERLPKEEPIAVPLGKLQPVPRRQKRINLSGDGGYTIMHTAAGDLYSVAAEPRRERVKKPADHAEHLIQCRMYNNDKPAPYEVHISVSCLIAMDVHAHTSRAEVMGLLGGGAAGGAVTLRRYRRAAAAAAKMHCDMDPVSQAMASEYISSLGLVVVAWHHSHPSFPPAPSATDLHTQRALQAALERGTPLLGVITSQHWPTGRHASQYRCIRVEGTDSNGNPTGYQFSTRLQPDLTADSLPAFIQELTALRDASDKNEYTVHMGTDVCPQAGVTYLEKCISSITHHMRSAGYEDTDPVIEQLTQGVRDVFR